MRLHRHRTRKRTRLFPTASPATLPGLHGQRSPSLGHGLLLEAVTLPRHARHLGAAAVGQRLHPPARAAPAWSGSASPTCADIAEYVRHAGEAAIAQILATVPHALRAKERSLAAQLQRTIPQVQGREGPDETWGHCHYSAARDHQGAWRSYGQLARARLAGRRKSLLLIHGTCDTCFVILAG